MEKYDGRIESTAPTTSTESVDNLLSADDEKLYEEAKALIKEDPKLNLDQTKELSVREMLVKLLERKPVINNMPIKQVEKKRFEFPRLWAKRADTNSFKKDIVLVLYFNQKGIIEDPIPCLIESGNMIIIKNAVYTFDPRALWLLKIGKNIHKVLCIREIDRRPISNLDLDKVRARGDATDSDSFLIKAALKEQTGLKTGKEIPKWIIWVVAIAIIGALGFFFLQDGGSSAANAASAATGTVIP